MKKNETNIGKDEFFYEDKGCKYSPSCLNCKLPACVEDGFRVDRQYSIDHNLKVKYVTTEWTEEEDEKLKQLINTDISCAGLSNIFRRTVEDIEKRIEFLGVF